MPCTLVSRKVATCICASGKLPALFQEQAVKMAFVKSAMALEIGDVSDIISSEDHAITICCC
eukprot:4178459-Amphidinium_carterae.1